MANEFDQFPLYDPIIRAGTNNLSDVWVSSLATLLQTLIGYLTSFGIFVPTLTTVQRNTIQSPEEGQMIYNITTQAPQIFQAGVWKTFTTV